jgi:potassium channel LctB
VRLLRKVGFTNLRIFHGGMSEWIESGAPVERGEPTATSAAPAPVQRARPVAAPHRSGGIVGFFDALASRSVGEVLGTWVGMILFFGFLYWAVEAVAGSGLSERGVPVPPTWSGLSTALYFSFVTATSVGYGDVVPVGWMRLLAIVEAASGILILGFIVSKFLSRRQEEVMEEIHRISFEARLDSVQTSLHLVLSDLQQILDDFSGDAVPRPGSIARAESAAMVFAGELRTIHGLLYRPQRAPDEEVLEAILANLAAAFTVLAEVVSCLERARQRTPVFGSTLLVVSRLGSEICGECVPTEFAPSLRVWMDRIQRTAGGLAPLQAEPS